MISNIFHLSTLPNWKSSNGQNHRLSTWDDFEVQWRVTQLMTLDLLDTICRDVSLTLLSVLLFCVPGIVTDPPYGVRAGAKKQGRAEGAVVMAN